MAVSFEHCRVMEKVGDFADAEWLKHGVYIAGESGFDAVQILSVGMAHPPLPIFAYYLGALPMASNGASVELWGAADPICLCILNVNHSQKRKSRRFVRP